MGIIPGASAPASEAGANCSPLVTKNGKITLDPIVIQNTPNQDWPFGQIPNFIIKGDIIRAAGTNRRKRIS